MKRILGFLLCTFFMLSAYAQTDGGEIAAEKKYNLRPSLQQGLPVALMLIIKFRVV